MKWGGYLVSVVRAVGFVLFIFAIAMIPLIIKFSFRYLTIAAVYAVLLLTVFGDWYTANTKLGDGIFFALVGLSLALQIAVKVVRAVQAKRHEQLLAEEAARAFRSGKRNVRYEMSSGGVPFVNWDD